MKTMQILAMWTLGLASIVPVQAFEVLGMRSHGNAIQTFNEPATRRGAGAAPIRRAARFLAGCFVARQSKTTPGILLPRVAHPAKIRSSAAIRASDLVH